MTKRRQNSPNAGVVVRRTESPQSVHQPHRRGPATKRTSKRVRAERERATAFLFGSRTSRPPTHWSRVPSNPRRPTGQSARTVGLVRVLIGAGRGQANPQETAFGRSQFDGKLVVEQRDGEDSPTTAACDTFEDSPPLTAVVVIPHDVSAFETALGDVMPTVGESLRLERGPVCISITRLAREQRYSNFRNSSSVQPACSMMDRSVLGLRSRG